MDASRQTYENERQRADLSGEQLSRALERSRIDQPSTASRTQTAQAADPFGGPAFGSSAPAAAAPKNNADPFGGPAFGSAPAAAPKNADPFGNDAFGSFAPPPPAKQQAADPFGGAFGTPSPAAAAPAPAPAPKNVFAASNDPFGLSAPAPAPAAPAADPFDPFGSTSAGPASGFDAAFDGGKEAKAMPHQLAGKNDPNARLAEIARNA